MLTEARLAELLPLWEQFLCDKLKATRDTTPEDFFSPGFLASRLSPEIRSDPRHMAMASVTPEQIRTMPDLEFLDTMDIIHEYYGLLLAVADHRKIMAELLAWIEEPEVVVDVGSGPCSYLSFLMHQEAISPRRAIGIDASSGAIKRGRELAAGLGVTVELYQALAQNLPLRDSCADLVISIDTLHWSHQWRQGLRQIARITKPRGRVFITHTTGCPRTMGQMTMPEVANELSQAGVSVDEYHDFVSSDSLTQRRVIKGTRGKPKAIVVAGNIH